MNLYNGAKHENVCSLASTFLLVVISVYPNKCLCYVLVLLLVRTYMEGSLEQYHFANINLQDIICSSSAGLCNSDLHFHALAGYVV